MLDRLIFDLHFALRLMAKRPKWTLVIVFCIALGIGPNTAIFSLVNGVLLRPLAVEQPQNLVAVNSWNALGDGEEPQPVLSFPDLELLTERADCFKDMVGVSSPTVVFQDQGPARMTMVHSVTPNYFDAIGGKAWMGDTLHQPSFQGPGLQPEIVLSHRLWRDACGADPNIVGRSVKINGFAFEVVGVMGPDFTGAVVFRAEAWVPILMTPQLRPGEEERLSETDHRWVQSFARLADGVTREEASDQLLQIALALEKERPETHDGTRFSATPFNNFGGMSPPDAFAGILLSVFLLVGAVLLVACSSVASMILARATQRRGELAIRLAVGATRRRVVTQLLIETLLMATIAGLAGLVLGVGMIEMLGDILLNAPFPIAIPTALDWRVVLYTAGLSLIAALVTGLAPALQATRGALLPALKNQPGGLCSGVGVSFWRSAFLVAQFAICTLLLIVAAAFVSDLRHAKTLDPGFEKQQLLTLQLDPSLYGYLAQDVPGFVKDMRETLSRVPGVDQIAVSRLGALPQHRTSTRVTLLEEDLETGEEVRVMYNKIGPDFLNVMGIQLTSGRSFERLSNLDDLPECVINRTFAQQSFSDGDAVGRYLLLGERSLKIVGVAEDAKYYALGEDPQPYLYLPMAKHSDQEVTFSVGVTGPPSDVLDAARSAVSARFPQLVLSEFQTVEDAIARVLTPVRILALAFSGLGALAFLLGMVGAFGLVAFSVQMRSHEIGVCLALGANPGSLILRLMETGLTRVGIGLLIGLGLAATVLQFMGPILDRNANHLVAFAAPPLVLALVACVALFFPAVRMVRREPMEVLRYE